MAAGFSKHRYLAGSAHSVTSQSSSPYPAPNVTTRSQLTLHVLHDSPQAGAVTHHKHPFATLDVRHDGAVPERYHSQHGRLERLSPRDLVFNGPELWVANDLVVMFVACVHWRRQDVETSSPDLNLRTRT